MNLLCSRFNAVGLSILSVIGACKLVSDDVAQAVSATRLTLAKSVTGSATANVSVNPDDEKKAEKAESKKT